MTERRPCCYVCLTGDVAVKVIDDQGFEHWFCAEDWAAEQELHEKIMAMLADAKRALEQVTP
jgi:prophage antirepressor-like protein